MASAYIKLLSSKLNPKFLQLKVSLSARLLRNTIWFVPLPMLSLTILPTIVNFVATATFLRFVLKIAANDARLIVPDIPQVDIRRCLTKSLQRVPSCFFDKRSRENGRYRATYDVRRKFSPTLHLRKLLGHFAFSTRTHPTHIVDFLKVLARLLVRPISTSFSHCRHPRFPQLYDIRTLIAANSVSFTFVFESDKSILATRLRRVMATSFRRPWCDPTAYEPQTRGINQSQRLPIARP
jgi:hypothetical protein